MLARKLPAKLLVFDTQKVIIYQRNRAIYNGNQIAMEPRSQNRPDLRGFVFGVIGLVIAVLGMRAESIGGLEVRETGYRYRSITN